MNHTALEAGLKEIAESSHAHLLDAVTAYDTIERANDELRHLTGIRDFFPTREAFKNSRQILERQAPATSATGREWGDFQTPPSLAAQVCDHLRTAGLSPRIVIEPTYGEGNFIRAALAAFPTIELVYGVELQEKYQWHLKLAILQEALLGRRFPSEIELHQDDVFRHQFSPEILRAQDLLIIGNPPWVTNAELGTMASSNLPQKSNLKALHGLDAVTGKSNFDIGEYVLLKLLDIFAGRHATLAVLCKNSVIRKLVEVLPRRKLKVSQVQAFEIDASREFGASVEASFLVMNLEASDPVFTCQVATLDQPDRVTRVFGWRQGKFVSSVEDYESQAGLDGESPLVWRQGLKHDCARIMEIEVQDGNLVNGNGEAVEVEEDWTCWLLKSSDLRRFEVHQARKKVIVPQHRIGESTAHLETNAPRLWNYLLRNEESLAGRKSSIYRHRPRFSIFGIGQYSFKKYKVGISGLYKEPCFSLVLPIDDRPTMLDDTCYFLSFDTYSDALFTASILNSQVVRKFLQAIVFVDAKRPYTKEVLMRIDLNRAAAKLSFDELRAVWAEMDFSPAENLSSSDFEEFKKHLSEIANRERLLFSERE